ncbi:ewing's tumor-associated antigen 1 [Neolamprologus brichardi]|uniref:ewing's tumor-associated antigen 1 n=1 Tax=Neolamprologus brichardi TaxID=32507 RepID=UPI001643E3CD|nr:ewing's tumor-associated antigen 1 [Neolamprologus brichardi]
MSGSRLKLGPLAAVMGTPLEEQQAAKPRANRLSRSSRQRLGSEQDSPRSQRAEFKTPTRIPRFRHTGSVCGESPHNESDFQQDIIWDATSPSPNRRGKRGKTRPAGAVSISEIVNRIAPKHGRPEDTDPTLQQWIGDSATIPCTPDVQPPKPKKKSPRPNAVDDLLKLAKQFDFNMFRRDEEAAEDLHQQSLELLSEDILDFENGVEIEVSPSLHGSRLPAASVVAGTGVRLLPDQHTDDDLDFLFDGPTQHVSGNLSQACSAQSQVKPPREASGKPCVSSLGPTSAVSTPHGNATSARDDFEDDWGDDDLLNDSLVLEMTQNPLKFASPKLCSTQKPAGPARRQREAEPAVGLGQSAATRVEKENVRPRATFLLEPNPAFSVDRIQNARRQAGCSSSPAGRGAVQSASSPRRAGQTCRLNSVKLQKPASDQRRTSAGICRAAASQTTNAPNFPQEAGVSCHSTPPADGDFLDDDLDAFFLSEPVWDDLADDELLCDMCEELESQIQGVAEKRAPLIGQIPNQSAALRPTGRTGRDDRIWQPEAPPPAGTGEAAGSSLAGGSASSVTVKVNDTLRFTGRKMASGSTVESSLQESRRAQWTAALQRAPQQHAIKDQFAFKRPTDPLSTATDDGRGKCSPAEIERKKQQAMARRRQRLQAAQNLRGVT